MAGRKEFELLFQLKASLGNNWSSTFKGAIDTSKKLQNSLTKLNSVSQKIEGFKRQESAVEKNRQKLAALTEEQAKLQREMKETEQPSEALKRKFDKNAAAIEKTTNSIKEQENKLSALNGELRESGIDTENLSKEQERLAKTYDRVKQSQTSIAKITARHEQTRAAISSTKGELTKTLGVIGAVGTAIYMGPVKKSMEFQNSMADVAKVVDGLKDDSGKTTAEYAKMSQEILKMSTNIPMTANDISQIIAAAGQSGIAAKELTRFASDAAKMGIAFDISAEQAGETAAKIRSSLRLTQDDFVTLADKVNYFGNTTTQTSSTIIQTVQKVGLIGKQAGVSADQIAALSSTMTGMDSSNASTALANIFNSLTKGSGATKKADAAYAKLGMTSEEVTKGMLKDSKGTLIKVFEQLKSLPAEEMSSTVGAIFGNNKSVKQAMSTFTENIDQVKGAFQSIENSSVYAGSMEKEYAARADTADNKTILLKNSLTTLATTFGNTFLPSVGEGAQKLTDLVVKLNDWVAANPEALKTILKVVGGLAALKVGSLGAKLGFLEIRGGVEGVQKVFKGIKGKFAEHAAEAATGGSKYAELAKNVKGYFSGVKGSVGGLGKAVNSVSGGNLGKLKDVFSKVGGSIGKAITGPLGKVGGKVTEVMSGVGSKMTGKFGKIGTTIMDGPLGKIGGKIGKVFSSLGGVAGKTLGPLTKGIGGMFGGLFGKIMPIILLVSLLANLFLKMNGGDGGAFMESMKQIMESARPVIESVIKQFQQLGTDVMPLLMDAAAKLAPLFAQIVSGILPILLELITQLTPLIITIVQTVLPAIIGLLTQLAPFFADIITQILPIAVQLLQILLPIITQLVSSVLPIFVSVIAQLLPPFMQLVQMILPILMGLLKSLMPVLTVLASMFSGVLGAAIQTASSVIGGAIKMLQGLIQFVTGIFTGNWKQAWEGVKNIFGGVFESLVGLVKAPFKAISGIINGVKNGISKVKDLVTGGGKTQNPPDVPGFAGGSNNTPDTFVAGENGAELITNAKGRKVFTAAQTDNIFGRLRNVVSATKSAIGGALTPQLRPAFAGNAPGVAPTVATQKGGGTTNIDFRAEYHVSVAGDKPDDLEQQLQSHDQKLLQRMKDEIKNAERDRKRTEYD